MYYIKGSSNYFDIVECIRMT